MVLKATVGASWEAEISGVGRAGAESTAKAICLIHALL